MKTLISRGPGTRVVCLGNITQIDALPLRRLFEPSPTVVNAEIIFTPGHITYGGASARVD